MQVLRQFDFSVFDAIMIFSECFLRFKIVAKIRINTDRVFRFTLFVPVKQLKKISEYLSAVTPVDLLDDNVNRLVRILPSGHICVGKTLRNK